MQHDHRLCAYNTALSQQTSEHPPSQLEWIPCCDIHDMLTVKWFKQTLYLASWLEVDVEESLDQTFTSDPDTFISLWLELGEEGQLLAVFDTTSKEVLDVALLQQTCSTIVYQVGKTQKIQLHIKTQSTIGKQHLDFKSCNLIGQLNKSSHSNTVVQT